MSVNNEEKNIEIVESEVLETELSEKEKESVSVKSMEIPVSELLGEKTGVEEKKEPSEREKELSEKGKKSSEKKKFKLSSGALSKVFSLSNILLGLRLCVIVAAVVFALAAVNYFTSPVIKGNEEEKGNVARSALVPDATSFSLYEGDIPESGRNVSRDLCRRAKRGYDSLLRWHNDRRFRRGYRSCCRDKSRYEYPRNKSYISFRDCRNRRLSS